MEAVETNAFELVAANPEAMFADGFTGGEPFFNVSLMTDLAREKLQELKSLPQFDLTTEQGRKSLRAAIKPVKTAFADFEKNIKVVKKSFSEIPKKCDAVSKALRDLSEPDIALAERPFAELKEQGALTERWWKLEGIPRDRNGVETLLEQTKLTSQSIYSSKNEEADFLKHKAAYVAALESELKKITLAEKAEAEEKQRLAEQAEVQRAIEAEQRRVAAELAEKEKALAAREAAAMQAAVNPGSPATPKAEARSGAPACEASYEMRAEAVEDIAAAINSAYQCAESVECAKAVSRAIRDGKIRHVRYCA